jgi:hypothetical protein
MIFTQHCGVARLSKLRSLLYLLQEKLMVMVMEPTFSKITGTLSGH